MVIRNQFKIRTQPLENLTFQTAMERILIFYTKVFLQLAPQQRNKEILDVQSEKDILVLMTAKMQACKIFVQCYLHSFS